MKISRFKDIITYLFLVLVLSMKMAGLHMLSHSDDQDHTLHCTVCDHVITHNLLPALTPSENEITFEQVDIIVKKETIENYNSIVLHTISTSQLFSRPPPFTL